MAILDVFIFLVAQHYVGFIDIQLYREKVEQKYGLKGKHISNGKHVEVACALYYVCCVRKNKWKGLLLNDVWNKVIDLGDVDCGETKKLSSAWRPNISSCGVKEYIDELIQQNDDL